MVENFIKNIVNSLNKVLTVLNEIDNLDGTYTLLLNDVWLIKEDSFILGNSNKYKVLNVNYLTNEITIKKSDNVLLSEIKCLHPFYYQGTWNDYSNYLTSENKKDIRNRERFPAVFMITEGGISEKTITNGSITSVNNLELILIDRSKKFSNKKTENLKYLDLLQEKLLYHININSFNFDYDIGIIKNMELNVNTITNLKRINVSMLEVPAECN